MADDVGNVLDAMHGVLAGVLEVLLGLLVHVHPFRCLHDGSSSAVKRSTWLSVQ